MSTYLLLFCKSGCVTTHNIKPQVASMFCDFLAWAATLKGPNLITLKVNSFLVKMPPTQKWTTDSGSKGSPMDGTHGLYCSPLPLLNLKAYFRFRLTSHFRTQTLKH